MSVIKRIFNAMIEARQKSAEREVAKILARTEFRKENPDYVEKLIRTKSLHLAGNV